MKIPRYYWCWPAHLLSGQMLLLETRDLSASRYDAPAAHRMVRVKVVLAPVVTRRRRAVRP